MMLLQRSRLPPPPRFPSLPQEDRFMFKTSLCMSEVQLELNALINMLFVLYLTCVRVNQGFLRADAAQRGDPIVVQTEHRASLGWLLSVRAPGRVYLSGPRVLLKLTCSCTHAHTHTPPVVQAHLGIDICMHSQYTHAAVTLRRMHAHTHTHT